MIRKWAKNKVQKLFKINGIGIYTVQGNYGGELGPGELTVMSMWQWCYNTICVKECFNLIM